MVDWPIGIRFGGLGGQGLVTLGAVLANAAARGGLQVAASQAYGSQARGGATRADVILSAGEIDFPHVIAPDVLVVLAQEAYDLYLDGVAAGGLVLADEFFVRTRPRQAVVQHSLAGTRTAIDRAGNKVAANFVMLGALSGFTGLVDEGHVAEAVDELVRERFRQVNLKAYRLGTEMGETLRGSEGAWR